MRTAAACIALVISLVLTAAASGETTSVKVWFLQGEQLVSVDRPGSTVNDAVTALLAGPTAQERKLGFRTYIPARTSLNDATVANGVATVDVALPFALGDDAASLDARIAQLVHTAVGLEGATKVRLLVDGGVALGMFPGIDTTRPLTLKYLETPNVPVPAQPAPPTTSATPGLKASQDRLVALGFLLPADADGKEGPQTQAAVLAFQKWEGLGRDGVLGPQTLSRLGTAARPEPITHGGPGKRAEVLLDRQVALAIDGNQVVRVLPVSTGKPSTPTPTGDFKVYAKIPKWWSTPFREWLLWAVPFNGGIAFHEFSEVPPYAASHGCVRQFASTAKWMYDFSAVGMPVKVMTSSQ
jgi:peptidoglycan hydrolase-like protein with peptidoglycan-binding domain